MKTFFTLKSILIVISTALVIIAIIFTLQFKNKIDAQRLLLDQTLKEKKLDDSLSKLKNYETLSLESELGLVNLTFQTKFISGKLKYKFYASCVDSIGKQLKGNQQIPQIRNYTDHFIISLEDADGFKLVKYNLPLTELTRNVDYKGETLGYSSDGEIPSITRETYLKIHTWTLGWHF